MIIAYNKSFYQFSTRGHNRWSLCLPLVQHLCKLWNFPCYFPILCYCPSTKFENNTENSGYALCRVWVSWVIFIFCAIVVVENMRIMQDIAGCALCMEQIKRSWMDDWLMLRKSGSWHERADRRIGASIENKQLIARCENMPCLRRTYTRIHWQTGSQHGIHCSCTTTRDALWYLHVLWYNRIGKFANSEWNSSHWCI